jgi:CBS domain-containing protein
MKPGMERVEVRIRRILGPDGESSVAQTVYCPLHKEPRLLVDCETCDRCEQANTDRVICDAPPSHASSSALARVTRKLLPTLLSHTTIGEVMAREAVCVTADMSVEAIGALLLERGFSGVPVVDEQGFPVGVVSKTDLLRERAVNGDTEAHSPNLDDGFHLETLVRATASEVMMPVAYTLEEHQPIGDAIRVMMTERVHRVPVVDSDGRVAGMLSTMDILRWLDG